ncbi:MAG: hypothetical protein HYY84_01390 [Deltaproteobacteria bacterium]|nr:hypothetical protein [Deltaproteobacteria bacterium]
MEKPKDNKSMLDKIRRTLLAIPADKVRAPTMPIDVYVGEVLSTLAAARTHRPRFEAINFPEKWFAQAEDGAQALIEAQAHWRASREAGRSPAFRDLVARARALRAELLATAGYAFRNDQAMQKRLSAIREGRTTADLAQDLSDLAALYDDNRPAFEAVGYDLAICDQVLAMREELLKAHAVAAADNAAAQTSMSDAKRVRNRAFTWVDEALAEIRGAGLYVLRNENRPDWLAAFRSRYVVERKRRSRANKTGATAPPTATKTNGTPPD